MLMISYHLKKGDLQECVIFQIIGVAHKTRGALELSFLVGFFFDVMVNKIVFTVD